MARIGVDVGGTHTDLVVVDDSTHEIHVHKVPSTVSDPSIGAIEGLKALCDSSGVPLSALDYFMHGTTVATNIALEHNGARTGLITTGGFRDILHIARHRRPQTFSLQLDLPWQKYPLVERQWRRDVAERITPPGDILVPLDEDAVREIAREFRECGITAVAVCFLFSFMNPVHEIRVGEILREEAPDLFISLSHEVVPQYREYERFSTTALNAYVGPRTAVYLGRLADKLKSSGVPAALHLMQSSGGAATREAATRKPVSLLMSGPAAGLLGGIFVGKSAGFSNIVTLDVGGTSADIGVAPDGQVQFKHILDTRIGPYQSMMPTAEVDAIGAGGGSIAFIDDGGQFMVGPRSAGSEPGPACYGKGGSDATVTDCMVVLGRITPDSFLGGRIPLYPEKALEAVRVNLAEKLGVSVEDAALGAIKILTHNMVQAIEVNSVRRGFDPRDFVLTAFGGGGPLFGCEIARELNIPVTVIPPAPGLTSALGLLTTDVAYDTTLTVMKPLGELEPAALEEGYLALESEVRARLVSDGFSPEEMSFSRSADCRYKGQGYELRTPAKPGPMDAGKIAALRAAFDAEHARTYQRDFPEKPVQVVNLRVVGQGAIPQIRLKELEPGGATPDPQAIKSTDTIFFEMEGEARSLRTPRYLRDRLKAGNAFEGPAVVEQMDTTTIVPPDHRVRVDRYGNLVIESTKGG